MADTKATAPVKFGGAYKESDTHVPDPTAMYDQFNTSGTGAHGVIEDVSPVFEIAKNNAAVQAANAIDPDHPEPASSLIYPDAQNLRVVDHDEIHEKVRARAEEAKSAPVVVGGPTLSERAAEKEGDDAAAAAQTETGNQGAGGSNVGQARLENEKAESRGDKGEAKTPHKAAEAKKDDDKKDDGK